MEPLLSSCSYSLPCGRNDGVGCKMKPFHNVVEPLFDTEEYLEYMDNVPILKRISVGFFSWAGDGVPNDAHFWGKQDFLSDPQFQGDSEINYFRKTNTDMVTFLQTEGWLCLVRIRKVLRMLNILDRYDDKIESLSRTAGFPVDSWGSVFEKMHPNQCRCAPCAALKDVKKQLQKKRIAAQEVNHSVIHHVRRCVYRVLISGIDRIFETFCGRDFSVVWFLLSEEFDEYYRDTEFEKLSSLIMNDVVAIEPITSLGDFGKMFSELYEGATDLARAVLHKFAVILGSQKMFYTTSMNFIMFYIESFNMIIRMLRWMETKFRVFNQLANQISDQSFGDKLDFKSLLLHVINELVYSVSDVVNRRDVALKVIATYQKLHKSYFGPHIENIERYLDYIDTTLLAASSVFQLAKLPCKCPTFKVPKKNVIDAALYINPYRDDQFDAPQVFHCFYQDRFIIERSQTPWKILYNNKAKILLRLTVENPGDKNKKLAINVFLAEESTTAEDRIKDQYFALYESRLERVVEFFDVLKKEVIEYYSNANGASELGFDKSKHRKSVLRRSAKSNPSAKGADCRRLPPISNKISVPVKLKRPDRRSRHSKEKRMAILASLIQKHRKRKKPSTIENLEQLLTFAVKTGVEGSGMLPDLAGDDAKDVYVSITSVDKARRAKADQELSLHELMSFIIFSYARHGCVTEFEGHTLHRTTFGCTSKTSFKDNFPLLYKAAEELDSAVGEGLLSDSDLAILEKGLSSTMTEEEIKRCKKGLEATLLMKREFNELVQSKRAFTKLTSSGFCVKIKKAAACQRKAAAAAAAATKVPEIRNRMRKALEERHGDTGPGATKGSGTPSTPVLKVQQGKFVIEEITAPPVQKPAEPPNPQATKDIDVDELVQLIEGTQIKNDPNPKKAAKKARQKEKKEQERQRQAEELAREEQARLAEERKRQAEERRRQDEERRKHEEEEKRLRDELIRKQKEAVELRKEEQRKKRQELERRKVEEKKLKKEAKKQRREQRKKELDQGGEVEVMQQTRQQSKSNDSLKKTENKSGKGSVEQIKGSAGTLTTPEKEYGRLKHEKEQRKREEEEARRLEQLQAQERVQATKKNKKKKKKQKPTSESGDNGVAHVIASQSGKSDGKGAPVGQPFLDILNASNNKGETQGKGSDEKSNLVTIRKHMDSSVTISMRGKEGEKDLVYTLMNGQVYPTGNDGKLRSEEALPLQQTAFARPEYPKPNCQNVNVEPMGYMNPPKTVAYVPPPPPPSYVKESSYMPEIDLSQLKLPPGITITRVPQNANGNAARAEVNGVQNPDFYAKTGSPYGSDYQRPAPIGGGESRFNSNIMIVDSRCSSLESPVTGVRSADMAYGAGGTRPSSEASIASDRPSSGMDSIGNNGVNPFVTGTGFQSTEMLNKRVPMAMTSPFTAASRNETPSPAWQPEMNTNMTGLPTMISHQNHTMMSDRQGLWSSTPASPVSFPQNPVCEGYLRAQDHQFIKPRPQSRIPFAPSGKPPPPTSVYNDSKGFIRRAADLKAVGGYTSNKTSHLRQGQSATNGASSPSMLTAVVDGKANIHNNSSPLHDQWTPWNHHPDRFSPDLSQTQANFYGGEPLSLKNLLKDDVNGPWESSTCEKPNMGCTNPFGPIGSNITRRSSAAAGHRPFDKIAEGNCPGEQPMWAYNPTF